jgi:hypothetical protein
MRRVVALLAALVLLASVGASSAAAGPGPKVNRFVGEFQIVEEGTWRVIGQVDATLTPPTDRHLVPGSYDFIGAPDNANHESHSQIGNVHFWFDPNHSAGGANVAFGEGVECIYWGPNDTTCHQMAVMFIDNLDRTTPDQVAFADHRDGNGEWVFEYWYWVGKGSFRLTFVEPS